MRIKMESGHVYIASVVATYWFVSISMVYLNKVLMSNEGISISAPLFITWFQCIVTAAICWIAGKVADHYKSVDYQQLSQREDDDDNAKEEGGDNTVGDSKIVQEEQPPEKTKSFWLQFPRVEYRWLTAKRVLPLSIIFVGMITFNNLCLKWVEVSFYNVARSLTIVFNVFFTRVLLGGSTSCNTIICLAVVIFGFLIGSEGELNFSVRGTLAGIMSSLFVSLNSIFTKKVLPVVDNDHWRLTFYNNANATMLFLPMVFVFERHVITAALGEQFLSFIFWGAMLVAGVFGFSIGIVTVLQIKATSPLTHNISGTAKAAAQSLLAFQIWGNKATFLGVTGIFTVLGGSLAYTLVKMSENSKETQQDVEDDKAPSPHEDAEEDDDDEEKVDGKELPQIREV